MRPENLPAARIVRGLRVLFDDGQLLYGARRLEIVASSDAGRTWSSCARLELPPWLRAATWVRAAERLTRTEVYKLQVYGNRLVALARGGVYVGDRDSGILRLSLPAEHGSRPTSLAVGPSGEVVAGEYHSNPERGPMRIHRSRDWRTWEIAHEFAPGEIRHVHGIYYDRIACCWWVLVGDDGPEAGIVRCSPDFTEVRFVRRGDQRVRAYSLLVLSEGLMFASDSDRIRNAIYFMDREGIVFEERQSIEASSFHSGMFGGWMVFSTVCEPSSMNDETQLHIWASRDGKIWHKLATHRRDRLPFLFQYPNVFFPEGKTERLSEVIYSGTALRNLDNATVFVPVQALGELTASAVSRRSGG
jgi:hypothetical protein